MTTDDLYSRLAAVMSRYLSDASVEATLGTVLAARKLSAAELSPVALPEVVGEAMLGLRTFCPPDRLPRLMLELADFCDAEGVE